MKKRSTIHQVPRMSGFRNVCSGWLGREGGTRWGRRVLPLPVSMSIAVCSAVTSLLCGLSTDGPASAATPPSASMDPPQATVDSPEYRIPPTHHWNIRSSVQVSRDTLREAYIASREAYTKKLQKYAKCTPQDAEKAVKAAHPGMKIGNLQLRNIRTNLVYMAVVEDDEDKFLVIVDAGNCKVLLDRPIPTHHERVFAEPY